MSDYWIKVIWKPTGLGGTYRLTVFGNNQNSISLLAIVLYVLVALKKDKWSGFDFAAELCKRKRWKTSESNLINVSGRDNYTNDEDEHDEILKLCESYHFK